MSKEFSGELQNIKINKGLRKEHCVVLEIKCDKGWIVEADGTYDLDKLNDSPVVGTIDTDAPKQDDGEEKEEE